MDNVFNHFIKIFICNKKGVSLAFPIILYIMIGIIAITVDLGRAHNARAMFQNMLDSATTGGAQQANIIKNKEFIVNRDKDGNVVSIQEKVVSEDVVINYIKAHQTAIEMMAKNCGILESNSYDDMNRQIKEYFNSKGFIYDDKSLNYGWSDSVNNNKYTISAKFGFVPSFLYIIFGKSIPITVNSTAEAKPAK